MSTTLNSLAFTSLGGFGVFAVTLAFYGCALKRRSIFIAARCIARPKNVIYNPKPDDPCQDRGNPWFGWIVWSMKLTYATMIEGIPGTGTRDGGLSGAMLKVNLDGIVLLRFHHLCLRVCFFATFVYLAFVLPSYMTSPFPNPDENLTDYEQLTLANLPALKAKRIENFYDLVASFFRIDHDGVLGRLYTVVICSWIVTCFAMHQLKQEWVDVLALRRVYYLEADHWNDRKEELAVTLLAGAGGTDTDEHGFTEEQQKEDMKMHRREPWVPHPEQRDTVPNVALYSLLVGGLPSLPTEVIDQEMAAVFSRKQSIDWQLSVTTAFFDHCVPNQPGFSSSVAAVTILPSASHLTDAWNHWYKAASKLRRLRYIRRQIADRRHYEIDDSAYPEDENKVKKSKKKKSPKRKPAPKRQHSSKNIYKDCEVKQRYYQEVLGSNTDLEVENNLMHALNFGPEQTAVYSREFALGAANLAPNGWFEERIRRAGIDELIVMEQIAVEDVHEANLALRRAQEAIAAEDDMDDNLSQEDLHTIMKTSAHLDETRSRANSLSGTLSGCSSDDNPGTFAESSAGPYHDGRNGSDNGSDFESDLESGAFDVSEVNTPETEESDSEERQPPSSSIRSSTISEDSQMQTNITQTILNTTQEAFTLGSNLLGIPNLTNLTWSTSAPVASPKRFSKANITSAQLPGDLGLEAELFLKNKTQQRESSRLSSSSGRLSNSSSRLSSPAGRLSNSDRLSAASPLPIRKSMSAVKHLGESKSRSLRRCLSNQDLRVDGVDSDKSDLRENKRSLEAASLRRCASNQDLRVDTVDSDRGSKPKLKGIGSSLLRQSLLRDLKLDTVDAEPENDMKHPLNTVKEESKAEGRNVKLTQQMYEEEAGDVQQTQEPPLKRLMSYDGTLGTKGSQADHCGTKTELHRPKSSGSLELASFWNKLEEASDRNSRLRAKLSSIQKSHSQDSSCGTTSMSSHGASTRAQANLNSIPTRQESDNESTKNGDPHNSTSEKKSNWYEASGAPTTVSPREAVSGEGHPPHLSNPYRRTNTNESFGSSSHRRSNINESFGSSHHRRANTNESLLSSQHGSSSHGISAIRQHTAESVNCFDATYDKPSLCSRRQPQEMIHQSSRSIFSNTSASAEANLRIALDFETNAGLRKPEKTTTELQQNEKSARLRRRARKTTSEKWKKVKSIVKEFSENGKPKAKKRVIHSGSWKTPTIKELIEELQEYISNGFSWATSKIATTEVVDDLARDSTYAVVTFTSRQAAVAARHCLADSRGADRWITVEEIPVPPLADAAVCNMKSFRGCVRPVTLSINDKQKLLRHCLVLVSLGIIYIFYTIPLLEAQELIEPERLSKIFPNILVLQESSEFWSNVFAGFIPALIWTGFFAVCPALFKVIANFGSNATSSVVAENSALKYFWWFMVLSAFSGIPLEKAVRNGFNKGIQIGAEIQQLIENTAEIIPTKVSANWLNWMIVRLTIVLPTQYLLQLNTFLFACLGLKCCSRVVRGGGAGPPIPYRIYIDSGVVMLCLFALAPASPLIAVAAWLYFLFCTPLLRWTMIFLYKPKFDIGGQRFPFIFDMCVSGMVVGQVLMTAMMGLKNALGPTITASIQIVPTIVFRHVMRQRYLRAFTDAALLQTSLLDGWDTNEETSEEKREEFRRFLVDSHKAAYVPVCIASDATTMITAEPAVVIPVETDCEDLDYGPDVMINDLYEVDNQGAEEQQLQSHQHQPGRMLRRASVGTQNSQPQSIRVPTGQPQSIRVPTGQPQSIRVPTGQPQSFRLRDNQRRSFRLQNQNNQPQSIRVHRRGSAVGHVPHHQPGQMLRRASITNPRNRLPSERPGSVRGDWSRGNDSGSNLHLSDASLGLQNDTMGRIDVSLGCLDEKCGQFDESIIRNHYSSRDFHLSPSGVYLTQRNHDLESGVEATKQEIPARQSKNKGHTTTNKLPETPIL